ncbi:MAG: hypothetical protein ACR2NB_13395, partial [Solirubrobacteraceae bacterium]
LQTGAAAPTASRPQAPSGPRALPPLIGRPARSPSHDSAGPTKVNLNADPVAQVQSLATKSDGGAGRMVDGLAGILGGGGR